jgi:hypothetical protein
MLIMLEAKRDAVEAIWWDPTLERVPTSMKHGTPVQLSRMYFYLPPELRAGSRKLKY